MIVFVIFLLTVIGHPESGTDAAVPGWMERANWYCTGCDNPKCLNTSTSTDNKCTLIGRAAKTVPHPLPVVIHCEMWSAICWDPPSRRRAKAKKARRAKRSIVNSLFKLTTCIRRDICLLSSWDASTLPYYRDFCQERGCGYVQPLLIKFPNNWYTFFADHKFQPGRMSSRTRGVTDLEWDQLNEENFCHYIDGVGGTEGYVFKGWFRPNATVPKFCDNVN